MNPPSLRKSVLLAVLWGVFGLFLFIVLQPRPTTAWNALVVGAVAFLVLERRALFSLEAWRREFREFSFRCSLADALVIVALLALSALLASLLAKGHFGRTVLLFATISTAPAILTTRELHFLTQRGIADGVLRVRLVVGAYLAYPALVLAIAGVIWLGVDGRDAWSAEALWQQRHPVGLGLLCAASLIQYALARRTANRLSPPPPIPLTERDLPPKHPPPPPVAFRWP